MKKVVCILGTALLFAMTLLTGCGSKALNLNNYLSYEVSGYNGYAHLSVSFSKSEFEKDLVETAGLNELSDFLLIASIEDGIDYDYEYSNSMSNGDNIGIKWDVNEELLKKYKIKVQYTDINEQVTGLSDIAKYDAFEGLTVNYEGTSPVGKAWLNKEGVAITELEYKLSQDSGLSNGDVITVSVSAPYGQSLSDFCAGYAMIPESLSKEFTVSGLTSFATSLSQVPTSELDKMKKQASQFWDEQISTYYVDSSNTTHEYLGTCFVSEKDRNSVVVIDKFTGIFADGTVMEYYDAVCYNDCLILGDGSFYFDYENNVEYLGYISGSVWFASINGLEFHENGYAYIGTKSLDEIYDALNMSDEAVLEKNF